MTAAARAIFKVPPFPAAHPHDVVGSRTRADQSDHTSRAISLLQAMRDHRVGGEFWTNDDVWAPALAAIPLTARGDDPLLLLGAIARRRLLPTSAGAFSHLAEHAPGSAALDATLLPIIEHHLISTVNYVDPFDGQPISALDLVEMLSSWRQLIDANRSIIAAFGFARWKRDTVDPMLWGGTSAPFRPARVNQLARLPRKGTIAVWKARVPAAFLAELEAGPWTILEVEDGFIRSAGLGADCVPPLSIVVDDLGVHYDCARPSRLEQIIARGEFSAGQLERAHMLRDWLVQSGMSKYGVGRVAPLPRMGADRLHLLVVGQVEDDRSVLFGGGEVRTNLELLQRVRALRPDSWIIYRPHPDVESGHRKGTVPPSQALELANQIEPSQPISALIASVDEVHVMTSLAGFEALLQGKAVTTHGTPFYAGWGLTTDLAPTPACRSEARSLDELTAAALLIYPRYVDPVTNLPCSAEIVVTRLLAGIQRQNAALVPLRRLLGWAKRIALQFVARR